MQINLDTPELKAALIAAVSIIVLVLAARIKHARISWKKRELILKFNSSDKHK